MRKLLDGAKNAVVVWSGDLGNGPSIGEQLLFDETTFSEKPKQVRLQGILFALMHDVLLKTPGLTIPLSGRGKLNFEEFHPLPLEEVKLTIEGYGPYFIMLDLEKH